MCKIGFFDSGVGGLTIWSEVLSVLPGVDTVYLADSAHSPYGNKSKEEIITLCIQNTQWLLKQGCTLIVVACNTATTQAIGVLRSQFSVPFVGIEPAIKPAALASKTRHIAVLATAGTLESELFHKTKDQYTQDVTVKTRVGTGLVSAIERGDLHHPSFKQLLRNHLDALITPKIDYLVLGCTHYPLFKTQIAAWYPDAFQVIDSGEAVALQVKKIAGPCTSEVNKRGAHYLVSSGDIATLTSIAEMVVDSTKINVHYASLYQSE